MIGIEQKDVEQLARVKKSPKPRYHAVKPAAFKKWRDAYREVLRGRLYGGSPEARIKRLCGRIGKDEANTAKKNRVLERPLATKTTST